MALSQEERRELLKLKEQGKSAFELKAALGALRLGQTPQFEEKIAPRKTFLDNRLETIKETTGDITETVAGVVGEVKSAGEKIHRKAIEKDRHTFQKGVGIGAEVFRGGSRVLGELVTGVAKTAVTQETEEKVAGKLEEVAEDIGSTEFVQGILTKYESLDPETKRQVDNVLGYTAGLSEIIGLGAGSKLSKPILRGIKETVDEALPVAVGGLKKVTAKGKAVAEKVPEFIPGVGGLKEAPLTSKDLSFLAQPKLTKRVKEEAVSKGLLVDSGIFKGSAIKPSKLDKDIAKSLAKLKLTNKDTPVGIFDKLKKRVNKNDKSIKKGLAGSDIKYKIKGKGGLEEALKAGAKDLELVFATDVNSKKTFDAVLKAFIQEAKKGESKLENLFIARQGFDKLPAVKRLLDSSPLGESLRKDIVLNIRGNANAYLMNQLTNASILEKLAANFLKKGNGLGLILTGKAGLKKLKITQKKFEETLREQSRLLQARDNLSVKEAANIGKSRIDKFFDQYPSLKRVAPTATGLITGGALF